MKARILFTTIILAFAACLLAQDSTQVVITHTSDQTPLEFLKANMWKFIFLVFAVLETWLGQTGKVKAGSLLAVFLNWIGKFLGKQADILKSKEDNVKILQAKRQAKMDAKRRREFPNLPKILLLGFAISTASIVFAQSPWNGFWKPVEKDMFLYTAGEELKSHEWLFRPTVSLSAMKFTPSDEEGKTFDVSSFTSAGFGLSYNHYVEANGKPYNNIGVNALMLFTAIPTETAPAGISLAATVTALQYLNFGVGWDFELKNYFLMAGVSFTF